MGSLFYFGNAFTHTISPRFTSFPRYTHPLALWARGSFHSSTRSLLPPGSVSPFGLAFHHSLTPSLTAFGLGWTLRPPGFALLTSSLIPFAPSTPCWALRAPAQPHFRSLRSLRSLRYAIILSAPFIPLATLSSFQSLGQDKVDQRETSSRKRALDSKFLVSVD